MTPAAHTQEAPAQAEQDASIRAQRAAAYLQPPYFPFARLTPLPQHPLAQAAQPHRAGLVRRVASAAAVATLALATAACGGNGTEDEDPADPHATLQPVQCQQNPGLCK